MLDSRPLDDPAEIRLEQTRRSLDSLRWLLLSIALLMVVISVVDRVLAPAGTSTWFISLAMGGVALLSYWMLRWRPRRWASPLMVLGVLTVAAWGMYSYGSVRAASSMALVGAVVIAGTYLSLWSLWTTTAVGLIILGGLTWAEATGQLVKPTYAADLRFWLLGSMVMAVIGVLLHHTRKATDEAYLRQLSQLEERLRLESEREQSQRRFLRIFRLNPTPLVIQIAATRTIQEVNPAFERSLGYQGAQLVGHSVGQLWADENEWQQHSRQLFARGRTDWQRCQWLRADGQPINVLLCSELSEDHSGMLILTTVLDGPDAA